MLTEIPPGYCQCGQPLHYSSELLRAMIERLTEGAGGDPMVEVHYHGRVWRVQRHYIALHGLKAANLPFLGFEEITDG
jgi:hypothetical protein